MLRLSRSIALGLILGAFLLPPAGGEQSYAASPQTGGSAALPACSGRTPHGPYLAAQPDIRLPGHKPGGLLVFSAKVDGPEGASTVTVDVLDDQGNVEDHQGYAYGGINLHVIGGNEWTAGVPLDSALPAGTFHLRISLSDQEGYINTYDQNPDNPAGPYAFTEFNPLTGFRYTCRSEIPAASFSAP